MKGSFKAYPYLMEMENAINERNNFVFMVVSTTGIDNSACDAHSPTRVCVKEYEYDKEVGAYKQALVFDELVKCTDEGLQHAIANKDKYDVFQNGGIDATAYINGDNVLSVDEFKAKFTRFMEGFDKDTVYIANGTKFCISYMDKIGCADMLKALDEDERIIDQTTLTKEYFNKKGIESRTATLDVLNHYVNHKEIASAEKIMGTDKRTESMANFMIHYGRENKWLYNDTVVFYNENNKEQYESMVRKGKEKYLESDFEGKFTTLLSSNVISHDVIDRDYPCDLNELYDVLEGKSDKKGIIIMQSATTGFTANDYPIQLTATVYELGKESLEGVCVMSMDINADRNSINKAIQNKEKGSFDAFTYTGINLDDYMKGISSSEGGVLSPDEAVDMINRFFKQYSTDEYALISNGKARNSDLSFTQNSMSKIGNLGVCNAPYIDFAQVVKEYTYERMSNDLPNRVIDLDSIDGSNFKFSLECIAENNGLEVFNKHTIDKCFAMASIVDSIYQDARERIHGIEISAQKDDEKEHSAKSLEVSPTQENVSLNDFVAGIVSGDVLNNADVAPADVAPALDDDTYFEIPTQAELLADIEVQAIMNGSEYGTRSLNERERELYSNKHNDTVPIVVTDGNVKQVGEAPIKHISEAVESKENKVADSNVDYSSSIAVLTKQTTALTENTNALREQNDLLKRQTEELSKALVSTLSVLTAESNELSLSNGSKINQIEQIKAMIDGIAKDSSSSVRNTMHIANSYLSNAQKEIESKQQKVKE